MTARYKLGTDFVRGDEAAENFNQILKGAERLGSLGKEGQRVLKYPHIGCDKGYWQTTEDDGCLCYCAYDNTTGDCWAEEFDTEEKAMLWLFSDWGNDECASNVLIEFLNPKAFLVQKHIGFAGDAREYEMRASIRGEPVLISTTTGRSITVTWERLVALAETIGLRCNMDSVENNTTGKIESTK